MKRDVYIQLPKKDAADGYCGKLKKSMYGTRDAATNFQVETNTLQNLLFPVCQRKELVGKHRASEYF